MQATAGQREPCGFLFLWAPAVPVKCRGKRGRQGEFPWGCGMPGDGEERSGPGGRRRFSMAGQGPPWKNQSRGLRPRLCGRCAPPPPPAGRWAFHQRQKDKKPGPTRYGAGRHNRWEEGGRQGSAPPGRIKPPRRGPQPKGEPSRCCANLAARAGPSGKARAHGLRARAAQRLAAGGGRRANPAARARLSPSAQDRRPRRA